MRVWVIEIGEPLPTIDAGERDWRAAMLSKALATAGHTVTWWASTFHHGLKRHRFDRFTVVDVMPGLEIRCLHGPGYARNASPRRIAHHRTLARAFSREAAAIPKPDVIFCCLPTLELADEAVKYGERAGVPVVID